MKIVSSINGGRCIINNIPFECHNCEGNKFTLLEGEDWIGHDKREIFFVAVCDECNKKLDISIEVG